VKNREIAHIFESIADILELQGENLFRVNAYRNAARILQDLARDVEHVAAEGKLAELPGFGKSIVEHVEEYLKTGRMARYQELRREMPGDLVDMLAIPGVGPRTIVLMKEKLGVTTFEDLKRVINDRSLDALPGMGEKKVDHIRRGYQLYLSARERMTLGVALPAAEEIVERLQKVKGVKHVSVAGSLRRMKETIGDIDILASGTDPAKIVQEFTRLPQVAEVLAAGDTRGSVRVEDGLQIDLRVVTPGEWGAALQYFTGGKAHNIKLRELAGRKGMKINEYGLQKGARRVAAKTEEDIYHKLGLDCMPPEMREDRGEIEAAARHDLPRIVQLADIRGDLQMHSTWSDGGDSIEAMAIAARKLGYEYILITDHSQSLKVAQGLVPADVKKARAEIDRLNAKLKDFRVLAGTEADILPDGSIDYPDKVLEAFDIVLASVHMRLDDPSDRMTERVIRAIENPCVRIIGHPTGRRFGYREASAMDMEKVMKAAAANHVALEINAHYERLDLNDVHARMAADLGVMLVISTDAHNTAGLSMMRFGVSVARRAWLKSEQVLNCKPLGKLLEWRRMSKAVKR
jgi:DNA polymerase (family 10)